MTRTTTQTLEQLVLMLNKMTKQPLEPYANVDGKYTANIGNYHLGSQYGGVSLDQMHNEHGGISTIFHTCTKRELETQLRAFIAGFALKAVSNG